MDRHSPERPSWKQRATFVRFDRVLGVRFHQPVRSTAMKLKPLLTSATMLFAVSLLGAPHASAQTPRGRNPTSCSSWATTSAGCSRAIYHRGLMVGETPNIDRIGHEGAMFMDYYAEQSCTAGPQRLLHRHASAAHRHDPAAAARQPDLPAARHAGARQVPARPRLQHRRVRQEPSRRPHRRAADGARLPGVSGAISITSTRCRG